MISVFAPILCCIPPEYYQEAEHVNQDRTDIYFARAEHLSLTLTEEHDLKKTLDSLTPKDENGQRHRFNQLSDDHCREILEKLHAQVGEECHSKLNQVGLEMVSTWSLYSNARAKAKLCALQKWLNQTKSLNLNDFSMRELRGIRDALKAQEITIQDATNAGQDMEIAVRLDEIDLKIRQTFFHGKAQTFIQLCDGRINIANTSLPALMADIRGLLKERNHEDRKFQITPPIKELTSVEVKKTVRAFKKNMQGWNWLPVPEQKDKLKHIDPTDSHPQRTVQERWNCRLENTRSLLDFVDRASSPSTFYAYEVSGKPVGIMVLNDNEKNAHYGLYMSGLVTHPGVSGAGGSLIEFAVNQSVKLGKQGKLSLHAINDIDTRQAYLAMGFKFVNHREMNLDPASSPDKWYQNATGEWKLKSHQDQRYLYTAFNSDLRGQGERQNYAPP